MRCCSQCGRPMRKSTQRAAEAPGTVRHSGRGLCGGCYSGAQKRDELLDHERDQRPWDELLEDVQILLTRMTPEAVATELGMNPSSIGKAAGRHGHTTIARTFWAAARREQRREKRAA